MKLINLEELDERIKLIHKPTPQQVLTLISIMRKEVTNPTYIYASTIGLGKL